MTDITIEVIDGYDKCFICKTNDDLYSSDGEGQFLCTTCHYKTEDFVKKFFRETKGGGDVTTKTLFAKFKEIDPSFMKELRAL